MKFSLKNIFSFEFIFYLIFTIGMIIWGKRLIPKIIEQLKSYKSFVNYIAIAMIPLWIYFLVTDYINHVTFHIIFDADSILDIGTFIFLIDIALWIVSKFIESYIKRNIYKKLDNNNPKIVKKDIENLINEQYFQNNPDMEKLYHILQLSSLSIKKQRKIIQSNLLKNLWISILFFVLGLIIPKIISFIL